MNFFQEYFNLISYIDFIYNFFVISEYLIILIAFVFIIAYFLKKCMLSMCCLQYHLLFKTANIIFSTICNPMHVFHSILNVILFSVLMCLHCCNKENWGKALLYVFSLLLVQTFSVLVCFISNLVKSNISM